MRLYGNIIHIIKNIFLFIMSEDEIHLNKILDEVSQIENLFKLINCNIEYINTSRDKIEYKKGAIIDDIKFYSSLLNNCFHYYKSNTNIRLNKLSKDLKNHFTVLNTSDYIGDICFNKHIIEKMFNSYKIKKTNEKETAHNFSNDVFWIKDIYYDELKEWPRQLYILLWYHRLLLEPLQKASSVEREFFEAQKNSGNLSKTCDIFKLQSTYKKSVLIKTTQKKKGCFGSCFNVSVNSIDEKDEKDEIIYKLRKQIIGKDIEIRDFKKELNKYKFLHQTLDVEMVDNLSDESDNNLNELNKELVEETNSVELDKKELVEETNLVELDKKE